MSQSVLNINHVDIYPKVFLSSPYMQFIGACLSQALQKRASDIHFEPTKECFQIRIRVDGDLEIYKKIPNDHQKSLSYELKVVFGLSISDTQRPADSSAYFPEWKLKIRANKTPTAYGEKIVLRLIHQSQIFDFNKFNYSSLAINAFKQAMNQKNGVIIVSGATGSGKSTTLSCFLSELNKIEKNISTLEDPIECEIPGVNHSDVGENMSFAQGLRSLLRQDPDVIMVGEIRDQESAQLCFRAANTGHLVLTTLHANDVSSVITRLEGLGLSHELIYPILRFVASQSLEKALCAHCSEEVSGTCLEQIKPFISDLTTEPNFKVRNESGCEHCKNGEVGRVAINECLFDPYGKKETVLQNSVIFDQAARGRICLEKALLLCQ